jgi:hypothetical protein
LPNLLIEEEVMLNIASAFELKRICVTALPSGNNGKPLCEPKPGSGEERETGGITQI